MSVTAASKESGWTLIELLVAMTLMLVVLSATLTSFNAFSNNAKRNFNANDQQDQLRTTLDQIVRQARNLANPTTGSSGAPLTTVAFADQDRLVFQTSDPTKEWVSYCLQASPSTRETIYYQTTANNSLTPSSVSNSTMVTGCPSANNNWTSSRRVGDFVTNATTNPVRALFSYFSRTGQLTAPVSNDPTVTPNTSQIVRVSVSLFMRLDPNQPPAETELDSVAFMRNQNQPPTPSFSASLSGTQYTFDGGNSSDPENRTLIYDWYSAPSDSGMTPPSPTTLPNCASASPNFGSLTGWSCLGTSVVLHNISFAGNQYVFLRVTDPGGLETLSKFPAGGCLSATSSSRVQTDCGAIP